MRWYVADKDFVSYLNSIDPKVENIDYGDNFKPYFGVVTVINGFNYYIPISSAKLKHSTMSNSRDFIKIHDPDDGKLIAVLNINNMIPIPDEYLIPLKYDDVSLYKKFKNDTEKSKYIDLLRKELKEIKKITDKIKNNAEYLHENFKNKPTNKLSQRCCNFLKLESSISNYKRPPSA